MTLAHHIETLANKPVNEDQARVMVQGDDVVVCVCDGHGGPLASHYVIQHLPPTLLHLHHANLVQHIRRVDVDLLYHLKPEQRNQGTTLACLIYRKRTGATILTLGDSQVYVYIRYPRGQELKTYPWPMTKAMVSTHQPAVLYESRTAKPWPGAHVRADLTVAVNMGSAMGDWTLKNRDVYETFCRLWGITCKPWNERVRRAWCATDKMGLCDPWPSARAFRDWTTSSPDNVHANPEGFLSNTAEVARIPAKDLEEIQRNGGQVVFLVVSDGVTDNLARCDDVSRDRTLWNALMNSLDKEPSLSNETLCKIAKHIVRQARKNRYKPDDITVAALLLDARQPSL